VDINSIDAPPSMAQPIMKSKPVPQSQLEQETPDDIDDARWAEEEPDDDAPDWRMKVWIEEDEYAGRD
jgi:hypothetical protein